MTGRRAPDSVGKRPPGFSGEVEARAVEAACAGFIPEWGRLPNSEAQDWRSDLSHALAAAAPIIAEAGYRAGIEEARNQGDFLGDDLSGEHSCHAGCPCHAKRVEARDRLRASLAAADNGENDG